MRAILIALCLLLSSAAWLAAEAAATPGPIYHGDTSRPQVSLMINVAWEDPGALASLLKTLAERQAVATFFFTGKFAAKHPEAVRAAAQAGHEIASHGYFEHHTPPELLRQGKLRADLAQAQALLRRLSGQPVALFAPHKGEQNEQVVAIAQELGQKTILWSLDTVDWREPSPETILQRIVPKAKNGDLILMHPKKNTALALGAMIDGLRARGFTLVTVSQALEPGLQALEGRAEPLLQPEQGRKKIAPLPQPLGERLD